MNLRLTFRKTAAAAALVATAAGAAVSMQPDPAGATAYTQLFARNSFLNVAVADGSTAPGARLIQWTYTGGNEQKWNMPDPGQTGPIYNVNSGLCVTTDGVPGHWLYQDRCDSRATQNWTVSKKTSFGVANGSYKIKNSTTGLVWDVQGYSSNRGANIDGWYDKGDTYNNSNQAFFAG
ncbi:MAG: RICIN domain-containing protein [Acidimicrobiia bacterium]